MHSKKIMLSYLPLYTCYMSFLMISLYYTSPWPRFSNFIVLDTFVCWEY